MTTATMHLQIFDGQRTLLANAQDLLLTARDGTQRTVIREFVSQATITLAGLPIRDNPIADGYTVLVSKKSHCDAGFTPLVVTANAPNDLKLMLLPRDGVCTFKPFANVRPDVQTLLGRGTAANGESEFDRLRKAPDKGHGLACLLNITTALEEMTFAASGGLSQTPLVSFKALKDDPTQDRVFAWAADGFQKQVEDTITQQRKDPTLTRLGTAPKGEHPGATFSCKQADFGEANVQFTFHPEKERVGGEDCTLVELDIDYFHDTAAHLLLEVFPNKLRARVFGKGSSQALTDPRTVYGLRWTAAQRRGRAFNPPYVVQ